MENIILLILFTYPGAFVEFTYYFFAKDRDFYHQPESYFRTARIFFFSAIITLGCLWLFGEIYHGPLTLSNAIMFLSRDNNAIHFAIVSCAASALLGLAWFAGRSLIERIENCWNTAHGKARRGPRKQVWMSMMADPNTPKTDYVAELYHDGKLVRRGLVYHLTNDPQEDNAMALMHCELVEEVLNTENQDLIGEPIISYVDMGKNNEIILRDGTKFVAWLAGETKEAEEH